MTSLPETPAVPAAASLAAATDAIPAVAPESAGPAHWPCLLGDVGGTFARFCVESADGRRSAIGVLNCDDYPDLGAAIAAYLEQSGQTGTVRHGGIAIATAVQGDWLAMPNRPWAFSIAQLQVRLQFDDLRFFNDFTALAMSLPSLSTDEYRQIGSGLARPDVIGLIGPGTGLGVGGLVPFGDRWRPLRSEGGHASFAPGSTREAAVLALCWKRYGHVSMERLLSGPGVQNLYQALAELDGASRTEQVLSTAEIVSRGIGKAGVNDRLCSETLELFCGMLGSAAGNLALTLGAGGGVFIGGGVLSHMTDYFLASTFRQRFEEHGRAKSFLEPIPTFLITAEYPAFHGVSRLMADVA